MKHRLMPGSAQGLFLVLSLLLLTGLITLRQLRTWSAPAGSGEQAELEAERGRLVSYTDAALAALREELARTERGKGPLEVPPGWKSLSSREEADHSATRYIWSGAKAGWADVVSFVSQLEQHSAIAALLIESAGTRHRRSIERVQIEAQTDARPAGQSDPRAPP